MSDSAEKTKVTQCSIARLPATSEKLFGRADDLAWLDACWEEEAYVASIVAWGGVGKSALVNRWLANMRDEEWRGAERVYAWSFYKQGTTGVTSSDEFIADALRYFGDRNPTEGAPRDKGKRLAKLVVTERTILILDGIEPLQWGPGMNEGRLKDEALAALLNWLSLHKGGLCIVTSRITLTDLEPWSGDKVRTKNLSNLSPEAGAELLKARGAKGPDEELREASIEYKGHSLALTLLGSYLAEVAQGDIRQRREIGPLEKEEKQGDHTRWVMEAYHAWIEKPEISILYMIGLFDRPAEADEIDALRRGPVVPGLTDALVTVNRRAWNRAIWRLCKVGLCSAEQDTSLDAHPLVREHFGEQFKREQPEAWREGHRRLYEHLKSKAKELPETIQEMAPLYAAVMHGCLAGKNQEVRRDVLDRRIHRGGVYFNARSLGAFGSELSILSAFFDPPWDRLAPGLSHEEGASVLMFAGFSLRAVGRLKEAAPLLRLSMERRISRDDWTEAARVASNLSELLQVCGKLDEALTEAHKSVELADKSGEIFPRLARRTTLAGTLHAMNLRKEATALFEEAEQMQKEREPTHTRLHSIPGFRYCELLLDEDRYIEVQERATQTLAWAVARDGLLARGLDHLSLGRAHLLAVMRGAAGDLVEAASHLQQAVDMVRSSAQQDYLPLGLLAHAAFHTHTRALAASRRDLDETLSLATRCGFRLHECDAHLGYARLCLAEQHPTAAQDHLANAHRIIGETGYHRRDGELDKLEAEAAEMAKTARAPAPSPAAPSPAKSMPDKPTRQPIDLGIVIALPEELRELLDLLDLSGSHSRHPADDLDAYLFTRGPYRCAVTLVGEMGETQAGMLTERFISRLDPGIILSIGIAGGVNDLLVGDVHVPLQAVQYTQDAKASPAGGGGFAIVPGAPAYRADFALHKAVRAFEFNHRAAHTQWIADCAADLAVLLPDAAKRAGLVTAQQVRGAVRLLADGHVATGPIVGAARAFSDWIRTHDRNIKSLEMESAAVLLAAQNRTETKRAFAIRGISDFGDEHKKELDSKGDGVLRRFAMRNAVRLLWALLDAETLPNPLVSWSPTMSPERVTFGTSAAVPPLGMPPIPRARVAGERRLLAADVERIHDAAVSACLAQQRDALLGGIDPGFAAGLQTAPSPLAQILLDLYGVDTTLADKTVPLFNWLRNARLLSSGRAEAAVFESMLAKLEASPTQEVGAPLPDVPASFPEAVRGSVGITLANLADKDALAKARQMGDGGSLDVVTAPPATFAALGVRDGASIRVIDTRTWRWRRARIMRSVRFHLIGLSRSLREHFNLSLDPTPTHGSAPLRGLTLVLSPFGYDVAISFVEADRERARSVAHALERRGVEVYLDSAPEPGSAAWCAVFLSAGHPARAWPPQRPLPAIPRAAFERGDEYLWPVILDGASVRGVPEGVLYEDPEQVAGDLLGRLQRRGL